MFPMGQTTWCCIQGIRQGLFTQKQIHLFISATLLTGFYCTVLSRNYQKKGLLGLYKCYVCIQATIEKLTHVNFLNSYVG